MSSGSGSRKDPLLFNDLPLRPEQESVKAPPAPARPRPAQAPEPLPLFPETDEAEGTSETPASVETRTATRPGAPTSARLTAGLVDLAVMVAVLLSTWAGLWWIGVELRPNLAAPLVLFLLPFSFLYQVFPLAFWGCTPGMARVGIVAQGVDERSLSFSQAVLRWVAAVATVATLGLPLLVTLATGRSPADLLSRSRILLSR